MQHQVLKMLILLKIWDHYLSQRVAILLFLVVSKVDLQVFKSSGDFISTWQTRRRSYGKYLLILTIQKDISNLRYLVNFKTVCYFISIRHSDKFLSLYCLSIKFLLRTFALTASVSYLYSWKWLLLLFSPSLWSA